MTREQHPHRTAAQHSHRAHPQKPTAPQSSDGGFDAFGLIDPLRQAIGQAGYVQPTPIQRSAIPKVMTGRDVMGLAQTGTGKTAAFALPILQRIATSGQRGRLRAVVIAPTRELAEQIHDEFQRFGAGLKLRSVTVYGGVSINPQVEKLRQGAEVAVACPGRLLDHIQQKTIDLRHVEVLVLDEADHMFDMGFLPVIRQILRHLPQKRQTLMFSATMPDDIRSLANEALHDPETVQVDRIAPATTVAHALYPVSQKLKTALLEALLPQLGSGSILVFTRTKHRAKSVAKKLAATGHSVTSLQGNLSQNRRQEALDGFRDGTYQIMVATDIAARGIDISLVSHVINFDIPDTPEAYTHRIGRTGRAQRTGDAFTFLAPEDSDQLRAIERLLDQKIERRALPGFNYQAAASGNEFAREPRPPRGPGRRDQRPPRPHGAAHAARPRDGGHARPSNQPARAESRTGAGQAKAQPAAAPRPGSPNDRRPQSRRRRRYGAGSRPRSGN